MFLTLSWLIASWLLFATVLADRSTVLAKTILELRSETKKTVICVHKQLFNRIFDLQLINVMNRLLPRIAYVIFCVPYVVTRYVIIKQRTVIDENFR